MIDTGNTEYFPERGRFTRSTIHSKRFAIKFSKIHPQFLVTWIPLHFSKTLAMLKLSTNRINSQGAQLLANMLQTNMVKFASLLSNFTFLFSDTNQTQVLTTLNLGGNEIDSQGTQYLAGTLESNSVGSIFFIYRLHTYSI